MVHNGGEVEATMVKARFGTDIRKMTLRHNDDLSYNDLVMMMQRIFKIKSADNIMLKYKDQEGDLITMADDHDLLLALQTEPLLSVVVLIDGAEMSPLSKIRSELGWIRDRTTALMDIVEAIGAGKGDQHSGLSVINCRSDTPPNILSESVATIQPSVHEQVNNGIIGVSGHPPAPCAAPPSLETTCIHPPNIPPAPKFIDNLQQQQQQHQQQQNEVEQTHEYNNTISDDTITTMTNNLPSSEVSSEVDITSTSVQHHPPSAPNGQSYPPFSTYYGGSEPPSTPMNNAPAEVQAQTGALAGAGAGMGAPPCGQPQPQPIAPPPVPMMMMSGSNSGSFGQPQQQQQHQMTPPPQATVPPTTVSSAPQFAPLSAAIPSVPTSQQAPMMMPPQAQSQGQQAQQPPQIPSSQPHQFGGLGGAPPQMGATGLPPMGAQQQFGGGMPPPPAPPTSSGGMMMHQQQQQQQHQQMPPVPPATTATPTFGMPPVSGGGVQMSSSQHQSGASTPAPAFAGVPPLNSQPPQSGGMMPPPPQMPSAQQSQQQQSFSTSSTPTPNLSYQPSGGAYHPTGMMSAPPQGAAAPPLGAPPIMPSFPVGGAPPGGPAGAGGTPNPFMRQHYARPPFPNAFQQ